MTEMPPALRERGPGGGIAEAPGQTARRADSRRRDDDPRRGGVRRAGGAGLGPTWSARSRFNWQRATGPHSGQGGVGGKPCNSPNARTPAQTNRRHRLPRARESFYGEPQDCSNDSAAGQCAQWTPPPLPGRLRRPPVERPACAPRSSGDADRSQPDTANYPVSAAGS